MKVIHIDPPLKESACGQITRSSIPTGTVITIGKFEALHQGHSHLIEKTIKYAQARNDTCYRSLASAVLSFAPHPTQVLSDPKYKPLFSHEEQAFLLNQYDIDYWIPYPFDQNLAQLSPKAFCQRLQKQFNCKALFIGEGFRFGRNREGTAEKLHNLGQALGIEIITIPYRRLDNQTKISTSQIRAYLAKGQIQASNKLLSRPFLILGTVQKGRQLGRTIGFPTANVHPADNKFLPPDGVYASKIIIGEEKKTGITNIGTNPTVADKQSRKVETHIFDFDSDIYGEKIIVELHTFIRPERTFDGIESLGQQIAADTLEARSVLTDRRD